MMVEKVSDENPSTRDENEPVVRVEHLKKSFGKTKVLVDFNLELINGENLVILGKSGSGKSILIKCIVGLVKPDSGTITVLGNEISELDEAGLDKLRSRIGFVFQNSALYDSMTVKENMLFALRRHKGHLSKKQTTELVESTLDDVGLLKAIDMMPAELSGGMRKRTGIARALVLKPEMILYDEPTTGLDPITAEEISLLMLDMQSKYKASSIIISHDMRCAKMVSNRLVVLAEGINYAEGTYEELNAMQDNIVHSFFK